jgi:hypothetical protein
MEKHLGFETRKSTEALIYSKELPLLNLANGYQLLRSFGKQRQLFELKTKRKSIYY